LKIVDLQRRKGSNTKLAFVCGGGEGGGRLASGGGREGATNNTLGPLLVPLCESSLNLEVK